MNTKRQTIWLVSMLSLMVVLSAYYLFTQDLGDADKLSGSVPTGQDATEAGSNGGIVVDEVIGAGDDTHISAINQQILDQLEREGFAMGGLFSELLSKRTQQYETEENRLLAVIADMNNDPEIYTAAMAEYELLEEKNSRIHGLEQALMEQYEIAMVSEEENERYKVVVTSEKLEKKDAASIIEQVIAVMEVKPEQVSVQYVAGP